MMITESVVSGSSLSFWRPFTEKMTGEGDRRQDTKSERLCVRFPMLEPVVYHLKG